MVKICQNCKTENKDSSEFCQNCGSKLNNVKSETGLKEKWDNKSIGGKVALGFGACVLGLILILVIFAIISPDNTTISTPTQTANNSTQNTNPTQSIQSPPVTQSKTYSSQGLTFNYPDSWTVSDSSITTPNTENLASGSVSNLGSLKEFASEDPPIPATLDSVAAYIRQDVQGSADKKDISIGGVNGIEYVPTGNGRQRVDVIFAKGDTLYSIYLVTDDYNSDKAGIDQIISTMKIN